VAKDKIMHKIKRIINSPLIFKKEIKIRFSMSLFSQGCCFLKNYIKAYELSNLSKLEKVQIAVLALEIINLVLG